MKLDLKSLYKEQIVPSMIKEFGYQNIEQVPKLVKISVNRGVGEAAKNSKELDASLQELTLIVGQQPTVNKAKKSVAAFKIRDGMAIGASATLRQKQMYNFFNKINTHCFTPYT
jgi:large subunit ribosomal protein L5